MNEEKVKLALHSAIDDRISIIKKFLNPDNEIFSLWDLCYWWDPDSSWSHNKQFAKPVLDILIQENCCDTIGKLGGQGYRKKPLFVDLLQKMLQEEIYLKSLENYEK